MASQLVDRWAKLSSKTIKSIIAWFNATDQEAATVGITKITEIVRAHGITQAPTLAATQSTMIPTSTIPSTTTVFVSTNKVSTSSMLLTKAVPVPSPSSHLAAGLVAGSDSSSLALPSTFNWSFLAFLLLLVWAFIFTGTCLKFLYDHRSLLAALPTFPLRLFNSVPGNGSRGIGIFVVGDTDFHIDDEQRMTARMSRSARRAMAFASEKAQRTADKIGRSVPVNSHDAKVKVVQCIYHPFFAGIIVGVTVYYVVNNGVSAVQNRGSSGVPTTDMTYGSCGAQHQEHIRPSWFYSVVQLLGLAFTSLKNHWLLTSTLSIFIGVIGAVKWHDDLPEERRRKIDRDIDDVVIWFLTIDWPKHRENLVRMGVLCYSAFATVWCSPARASVCSWAWCALAGCCAWVWGVIVEGVPKLILKFIDLAGKSKLAAKQREFSKYRESHDKEKARVDVEHKTKVRNLEVQLARRDQCITGLEKEKRVLGNDLTLGKHTWAQLKEADLCNKRLTSDCNALRDAKVSQQREHNKALDEHSRRLAAANGDLEAANGDLETQKQAHNQQITNLQGALDSKTKEFNEFQDKAGQLARDLVSDYLTRVRHSSKLAYNTRFPYGTTPQTQPTTDQQLVGLDALCFSLQHQYGFNSVTGADLQRIANDPMLGLPNFRRESDKGYVHDPMQLSAILHCWGVQQHKQLALGVCTTTPGGDPSYDIPTYTPECNEVVWVTRQCPEVAAQGKWAGLQARVPAPAQNQGGNAAAGPSNNQPGPNSNPPKSNPPNSQAGVNQAGTNGQQGPRGGQPSGTNASTSGNNAAAPGNNAGANQAGTNSQQGPRGGQPSGTNALTPGNNAAAPGNNAAAPGNNAAAPGNNAAAPGNNAAAPGNNAAAPGKNTSAPGNTTSTPSNTTTSSLPSRDPESEFKTRFPTGFKILKGGEPGQLSGLNAIVQTMQAMSSEDAYMTLRVPTYAELEQIRLSDEGLKNLAKLYDPEFGQNGLSAIGLSWLLKEWGKERRLRLRIGSFRRRVGETNKPQGFGTRADVVDLGFAPANPPANAIIVWIYNDDEAGVIPNDFDENGAPQLGIDSGFVSEWFGVRPRTIVKLKGGASRGAAPS